MANVDKQFPAHDTVNISALLDPVSKNKKYSKLSKEDKHNLLTKAIENMQLHNDDTPELTDSSSINAQAGNSKRLRLMDKHRDESEEDSDMAASIAQYLSIKEKSTEEERVNILLY